MSHAMYVPPCYSLLIEISKININMHPLNNYIKIGNYQDKSSYTTCLCTKTSRKRMSKHKSLY